jgi:hypothetical protein
LTFGAIPSHIGQLLGDFVWNGRRLGDRSDYHIAYVFRIPGALSRAQYNKLEVVSHLEFYHTLVPAMEVGHFEVDVGDGTSAFAVPRAVPPNVKSWTSLPLLASGVHSGVLIGFSTISNAFGTHEWELLRELGLLVISTMTTRLPQRPARRRVNRFWKWFGENLSEIRKDVQLPMHVVARRIARAEREPRARELGHQPTHDDIIDWCTALA